MDPSLELQAELAAEGIDSAVLREINPTNAMLVSAGPIGVDPLSPSIIIAFAPSASNNILKNVWSNVILPRISRRWGNDAIGRGLGGDHSGD